MKHFPRYGVVAAAGLGMLAGGAAMTGIALGVLGGTTTTVSVSGPLKVGQLAAFCRGCGKGTSCGPTEQFGQGYCQGFMSGVMENRLEIGRLCLPTNWTLGQEVRLFLAWAGQHPGEAGLLASDGIVRAHAASFDCRKSGGGV